MKAGREYKLESTGKVTYSLEIQLLWIWRIRKTTFSAHNVLKLWYTYQEKMSRRKQTQNPNENYPENAFFFFFFLAAVIGSHFARLPQWGICTNNCIFIFFNFGCAGLVVIACEFNGFMACGIIVRWTGIEPTFQWRQILNHWATRKVPRIIFVKAWKVIYLW